MTLIASMLSLSRRDIKELRITDPYSLHRVVYSLFDDVRTKDEKQSSKASGFLFADKGGNSLERHVLLLSDRSPSDRVDGKYGKVESKVIPDDFLSHSKYRFLVIVNPTRRDSKSRKLIPIKGREEVAKWFIDRAQNSWGFDVSAEHLQIEKIEVMNFKAKNDRLITLSQATVSGSLSVLDKDKFELSFKTGIGRSRAFGCGLLQLVPTN